MKLNDLFTRSVVTAGPEETVASIARKMKEHNTGTVVVVEDQRPVGIVTDRDLAMALGVSGVSLNAPVKEMMSKHVLAVPEETGIFTATRYIRERGVRRLPIVDKEDRLVGLVSLDDLLRSLASEFVNLVQGIETEMKVR